MRKWLKAGLIGAGVECALSLLSMAVYFLPSQVASTISCVLCGPIYLVFGAAGGLAGYWVPAPRARKDGARAGAKAGLAAGAITMVWNWILMVIMLVTGVQASFMRQAFGPEQIEVLREMGMEFLLTPTFAVISTVCGGLLLLGLAAGLGALGGLIMASPKGVEEPPVQQSGGSDIPS